MKVFRTPSWFRTKGRIKETQVKAHNSKPKAPKIKKRKQEPDSMKLGHQNR